MMGKYIIIGARWIIIIWVVGLAVCLSIASSTAQDKTQTKEERLYQVKLREAELNLERARIRMERAKRENEETQRLFEEELVTLQEANQKQRSYETRKMQYEQEKIYLERLKLEFLADATYISIVEAKKYRTLGGRRMVEITLQNTSDIGQAVTLYEELSEEEVAPLLEIQNIIVSITSGGGGETQTRAERPARPRMQSEGSEEGSGGGGQEMRQPTEERPSAPPRGALVVAEPYEIIVPSLKLGERKTLTFRLLRDSEEVGVQMRFLDIQRTIPIFLKKEALQDLPTINSVQFSQEGDLNSKVDFDIILERLAEEEKTFRLAVLNLPQEIDFSFIDPATGASLNQVKFTETLTKIQLNLRIAIPEKLSRKFVDETIEFFVFVTQAEEFKNIGSLSAKYRGKQIPVDEINKIKGNKVKLELIPRGEGELEVVIANRYQEIKTGEDVTVRVDVHNTGTLAVQNVKTEVSVPLDWQAQAAPPLIKEIEAGEKEPINIKIAPPGGVSIGEYDVIVETEGTVGNEKVESEEKSITVRIAAKANILKSALLITGLIALVLGMVVASIKISRR